MTPPPQTRPPGLESRPMDLSDLARAPLSRPEPPAGNAPAGSAPVDALALVAQLGSEVAGVLTQALERVNTLAASGRIDRDGLRALRDEIERARRMGIMGQQLSRLAGGRVPLARERLSLTELLREALRLRAREIEARGLEVRQVLAPAEITSDATLMFSLLQALLDWSFEHTVSRVDLTLDIRNWPAHARIACRFRHRPADEVDVDASPRQAAPEESLETMSWQLLQHTARALGLGVERRDAAGFTTLTLEFADTLVPRVVGLDAAAPGETAGHAAHSNPLSGRHVLVLAARRETRALVRDALRPMGMMADYAGSLDEAAEFCRATLPHAIVYDAALADARFEPLRQAWLHALPTLVFVELAADARGFEMLNAGAHPLARVGRDDIAGSLPAALSHELTRLAAPGTRGD